MSWHMPSRSNKLLFWSLIALAVAMVLAVALAFRGFNREGKQQNDVSKSSQTKPESNSEKTVDINEIIKTGTVTSVIEKKGSPEKWVTLAVPSKMEGNNEEYLFYIHSGVEGVEKVQSGSSVSLTPETLPSKKEYIPVRSIEFIK